MEKAKTPTKGPPPQPPAATLKRPAVLSKTDLSKQYVVRQYNLKKWMEGFLEKPLDLNLQKGDWKFRKLLTSGVVLCHVMKKINPDLVPLFHEAPSTSFKCKENISYFVTAVENFGVARYRLFDVGDLYDSDMNFHKVVECLEELATVTANTKNIPFEELSQLPFELPSAVLQEAENQLRFVKLKPRVPKAPIQRVSVGSAIRKSMALVAVNNEHLTQITKQIHEIKQAPSSTVHTPSNQKAQADKKSKVEKGVTRLQAFVRGRIARRKYRKMLSDVAYRSRVCQEIVSTEKAFVNGLDVVHKVYFGTFKEKSLVKPEILKALFPDSLQVISAYNKTLLGQLEPVAAKWGPHSCIGQIFVDFGSFLKVYTQYIKDFTIAQQTLDKLKTDKKILTALQTLKANPQCNSQDLDSFLILPVQRIPRYKLLLSEMLKHTWPEHADYANLKDALEKVHNVANYINERKREAENLNKILEIQQNFAKIENLADPSRRFVREGHVTIVIPTKNNKLDAKERFFVLFNDKLLIAKNNSTKMTKGCLELKDSHEISKISFKPLSEEMPTSFSLCTLSGDLLTRCFCISKDERDSWFEDLQKTKEEIDKIEKRNHEMALKRASDKAKSAQDQISALYNNGTPLKNTRPNMRSATMSGLRGKTAKEVFGGLSGSLGVTDGHLTGNSNLSGSGSASGSPRDTVVVTEEVSSVKQPTAQGQMTAENVAQRMLTQRQRSNSEVSDSAENSGSSGSPESSGNNQGTFPGPKGKMDKIREWKDKFFAKNDNMSKSEPSLMPKSPTAPASVSASLSARSPSPSTPTASSPSTTGTKLTSKSFFLPK